MGVRLRDTKLWLRVLSQFEKRMKARRRLRLRARSALAERTRKSQTLRKTEPELNRKPLYSKVKCGGLKYVTATLQPHIIIKNTSAFEA